MRARGGGAPARPLAPAFLAVAAMLLGAARGFAEGLEANAALLSVDGKTIQYYEYCPGPSGTGAPEPILYLHGWAATGREAALLAEALGPGRRFVSPDWPGVEGSAALERYSMAAVVAWLGRFVEETGLGRAVLVGHSLGGHLALRLALERPDLVSRIVLIDPAGLAGEEGVLVDALKRSDLAIELSRRAIAPWMFGLVARVNVFHDASRIPRGIVERDAEAYSSEAAKAALAAITRDVLGDEPVDADLGRITCPALLVWGRKDRVLPFSWSSAFMKGLPPGAALVPVDDCGHCPQLERPEETAAAIRGFLGR